MTSEKKLLIAFALSMVWLLVMGAFFIKKPKPTKPGAAPAAAKGQTSAYSQPAKPAAKQAPAPPSPSLTVAEGTKSQDIVVTAPLYQITFSTQGAVVKRWVLTKYHDAHGKPLNIVNGAACDQLGFPMTLSTGNPKLDATINKALFVAKPGVTNLTAPATLDFVYSNGTIEAEKKFTFGTDYQIEASVSVVEGKNYLPVGVRWPGGIGDHSIGVPFEMATSAAAYDNGKSVETTTLAGLGPGFFSRWFGSGSNATAPKLQMVAGPLEFAGLEDRYFAGIFFPMSPSDSFHFEARTWKPANWKAKIPAQALDAGLEDMQAEPLKFSLFVAPKAMSVLSSTVPPLDGLLDWGWFGFLAKPLFYAMQFVVHHWVHNYGWAIVILTILINIAIFPLRLKSIRSAQAMQRVMPQYKAIQERYKQYKMNDPRKQRMNQEIMKLYQEHGVNPFGSCLPMVLQFPVVIAFYRMLELPIQFRHAHWILWFKDLSQPDNSRLFGLPIPILWTVMMIASVIMTVITPMPGTDPQQKKMMMFMPVVLGFIFLRWASGLVLYYLTFNVAGIAIQLIINRWWPMTAPAAPAAGKAASKAP